MPTPVAQEQPRKKRNRWDETPAAESSQWDATPKSASQAGGNETPSKKSRWDSTPVGASASQATPVGKF